MVDKQTKVCYYINQKRGDIMVTSIEREMHEDDGTIKTILITSNDPHTLDLSKTYKLDKRMRESKLTKAFKNSVLGTEIGIKAEGFTSITILATLLAIGSMLVMYAFWRV